MKSLAVILGCALCVGAAFTKKSEKELVTYTSPQMSEVKYRS